MQTNYESILTEHGYERKGGCNCGGVLNRKYRKGDITVYLRPRQFKIKRGGTVIVPLTDLNKLNETLAAEVIGV